MDPRKLDRIARRLVPGPPRRRFAVAAVIVAAAAVAITVAMSPAVGPSPAAVRVQQAFTAYLAAANANDGTAACALLTRSAQEDMQRLARSPGGPTPSCQSRFQSRPDASSGRTPAPVEPIVIDFVNSQTAAAHQQGSAGRVLFALTGGRWLIAGFSFEPPNGGVQSPAGRALGRVGLVLVVLGSLLMGYRRIRWRWVVAATALPIALGAWLDSQEPSTYDLRGLGLLLGIAGAALFIGLVLVGRLLRPQTRRG